MKLNNSVCFALARLYKNVAYLFWRHIGDTARECCRRHGCQQSVGYIKQSVSHVTSCLRVAPTDRRRTLLFHKRFDESGER